jgi:hypothetical protein
MINKGEHRVIKEISDMEVIKWFMKEFWRNVV